MAYTIGQLEAELQVAKDSQNAKEIKDLTFLIEDAKHGGPNTSAYKREIMSARNRMNSRRYGRKNGRIGINIGDEVSFPDGKTMIITRIANGVAFRDVPGEPMINCPTKMLRLVDKAVARAARRVAALEGAIASCAAALEVATEWEHVDAARQALSICLTPAQVP